jgi:CubicO group peptidase (beta-lactamase class C family)
MTGAGTIAAAAALPWPARAAARLAPGGFSAERLADARAILQSYVNDGLEAGFVTLISRRGEIAQVNTVGWQDREAKLPMRRDTIFRLASMTKPITCVGALTLVDAGKIGLNDPITRWIPEFANLRVLNGPKSSLTETHAAPRPITVADLLTHRSGFVGMMPPSALTQGAAGLRRDDPDFTEWARRLGSLPLEHNPGAHFTYGTSHDVLGLLIERVSGQGFEDYLRRTIFDPLGMKDTAFWVPSAKRSRLAVVYAPDTSGRVQRADEPVPSAPPKRPSGAGGLVSTADDYLRFAQMLLGRGRVGDVRILNRPTVAMMTTDWLTPAQRAEGFFGQRDFWLSQGFGLGVSVTDDVSQLGANPYSSKGSYGWPGRTGVWWRADPVEDMAVIYLVQNPGPAAALLTPGSVRKADPSLPVPPRRPPAVVSFINAAYRALET